MKHSTNTRRGRNRGNGKRGPTTKNQTFESNGPEGKIRGTAQQVHERYLALGRDATSSGDPISAEGFFQHAEHYYRVIAAFDSGGASNGGGSGTNGGERAAGPERERPAERPSDRASERASERGGAERSRRYPILVETPSDDEIMAAPAEDAARAEPRGDDDGGTGEPSSA